MGPQLVLHKERAGSASSVHGISFQSVTLDLQEDLKMLVDKWMTCCQELVLELRNQGTSAQKIEGSMMAICLVG